MMKQLLAFIAKKPGILILFIIAGVTQYSCSLSAAENPAAPPPPQLPVLSLVSVPATTYQEFPASLEGKVNVEIRPQVDGYLEKIYVDEGAYVKAGQPLFKINDRTYNEQLSDANSGILAAQANMQKASLEVERLKPLVENNVIADVQLKTAQSAYEAAKAEVEQAKAVAGNAQIDVGYTLIKAPVSGYIGRIPFKTGSLVGRGETQPLTVLSDVSEIYAYFSLSEPDFIAFKNQFEGNTIEEKIKQVPAVEMMLADNSIYTQKGKIGTVEGQFDKTIGAISFRATFPNPGGVLRSGNTGKIRISKLFKSALIVPQDATFEIQDKTFVYAVGDSNKIVTKPIIISGRTTNYYYVSNGVQAGEKIVLSSQSTLLMGGLRDGMPITPQMVSTDSLFKAKPL
jgi:membrane fusion protein (multidrug efflux system)